MRKCSDTLKAKIASIAFVGPHQPWLRAAVSDCLHGRPVSLERERKMCAALGLPVPKRRSYYRPCLSPEVGEVVKERGLDVQRIVESYITDNYLW